MTVAAKPSKIDYLENGVTTSFAVPFRFIAGTITASRVLADGTVVALASGVDFSTSGGDTDDGGTLALTGASVAGAKLRIRRGTPRTQAAVYVADDSFPAESHEQQLDRQILIAQELADKLADTELRALLVPDGEIAPGVPSPADNAGKFLTALVGGALAWASGTGGGDAALRVDLASLIGAQMVSLANGDAVQTWLDKLFVEGPAAPTPGNMALAFEHDPDGGLIEQAGIWSNLMHWEIGLNKRFILGQGTTNGPSGTLFVRAENAGSEADIVAGMFVTVCTANDTSGFAINGIAGADPDSTNVKLVVVEWDWEPSIGTGINPGSICEAVNAFSEVCPTGIQFGGIGGGSFDLGIAAYGISDFGTFIGGGAGETMQTFIDTGACTYNGAAILLHNTHRLGFFGTAGRYDFFTDAANNLRIINQSNIVVRDNLDGFSGVVLNNGGNVSIGRYASIGAGYKLDLASDGNIETGGIIQAKAQDGTAAFQVQVATGAAPNGAASAVAVRANSSTSRSINAGGTINASGADYAEYERKRDDCGRIEKGAIIGFDADGLLTDRFADAVSFAVKSTNPNLVGGDTWGVDLTAPTTPVYEAPEYTGPQHPGTAAPAAPYGDGYMAARRAYQDAREAYRKAAPEQQAATREAMTAAGHIVNEYREAQKEAQGQLRIEQGEKLAAYEAAWAEHLVMAAAHREEWEATVYADYLAAFSAFEAEMNTCRAPWDRIAYCGKVPVNVLGASPGQHVVPIDDGSGGIAAELVDDAAVTFEQYRRSVGQVRRILDDGRAEISVKPV